ncbi:MFS transporter [Streptococcus ruminantium]|uniref:MFS transporter n=1 Tax=Streptococcus ruminantium TaxID=1917441 RepID=UPI0013EF54D8|nr:MFS transporter [Streptococcus ruminantium]
MKSILKNKLYLILLVTDLFSNFGDILYYFALMLYVLRYQETQSAISIITLSETLPILSGILLGFLADKAKRKVLLVIVMMLFRFVIYIGVAQIITNEPTQWIIWGLASVNLLSDLAGQFENSLFIPIKISIIPNEQREKYMGLSSSISLTASLAFNSLASILVVIFSMKHLAYLNAITFLMCALIMLIVNKRLSNSLIISQGKDATEKKLIADFCKNFKLIIVEMWQLKVVRVCMFIVPFLNTILSGITIISILMIKNNNFIVFNPQITLAAINLSLIIGQIFGNLIVTFSIVNVDSIKLLKLSVYTMNIVILTLMTGNFLFFFLSMLFSGILMGIVNPKLMSVLMNNLPESRMSMMASSISNYFTMGIFISKVLISVLIVYLIPMQVLFILGIISISLTIYILIGDKS